MLFELKMNFFVTILISCCLETGFGTIKKAPGNVVALVGTTATLECCNGVGHHSLLWRRVSLGTRESSDIYLGESDGFVDNFRGGRFSISNGNTSGCYNLIISDIQRDDAGTYTCADEYDLKHSKDADITILESFACHEVFPNKKVYMGINEFGLEPDTIQLMCSIKYIGNFIPEMEWKWRNSSKISNVKPSIKNLKASLTSISIATFDAVKEFDQNEITCFAQSPGDEDLSRNPLNLTSKLYRVKYATFRNKEVVNCTAEEVDLQCNPPCSISSVENRNGSYICKICFQNELPLKKCVDLNFQEGKPEDCPLCRWSAVTIIAVMVVAVALISVFGILIYRLKSNGIVLSGIRWRLKRDSQLRVPV